MTNDALAARTAEELCAAVTRGARMKYLAFWGHRPRYPGEVGPSCLSQWYEAPFEAGGVRYPTAEHYMMAGKARLFGDHAVAEQVLAAPSPGAAKDLGRRVARFDEDTWVRHRFALVVAGSEAKFGAHPELLGYLLGTSGRVLVEASPLDRVWGIGLAADDRRTADPRQWRGLNLLGFALMEARTRLSSARAPGPASA
ncbi:NADAR family protein [Spirilliplanes yamanashiensis]|uniref:NADAR domain-containing protein n=1 Tax=Spirilliplanes yamanashiensis TaxID=42233 RepID=A0A8J3YAR2_9ACTN|nr:ribA/ribD-fused uncharacterized protein [Spirilliplanes yamanashiensis]GIJ05196.1 hypothetical protein Sya03_45480 [Spirilliplanes yamanashiensis]